MAHFRTPHLPPPAVLRLLLILVVFSSLAGLLFPSRASLQNLPPGKLSSSAIALTRNGDTLAVVNPDSNTLTLVAVTSDRSSRAFWSGDISRFESARDGRSWHQVLREVQVGIDPRSVAFDPAGTRAYVANRGSASVSVVDVASQSVATTIGVGYEPYGVVVAPDGQWVYVANAGSDTLSVSDAATSQVVQTVPVGDRPTGLALSENGQRLYVTHLLTGEVSVLDTTKLPGALPDCSRQIDFNLDGTVTIADLQRIAGYWGTSCRSATGYHPRYDPSHNCRTDVVDVMLVASRWGDETCPVISTGPDSNLAQSIAITPDGTRAYLPHQRSNASNPAPLFDTSIFPVVSVIDLASNQHLRSKRLDLATVDVPVNMPFDAAFAPDGSTLYVVNAGSNDVSVIDLSTGVAVAHVEVGANPRGIVVSPDGTLAYVNNTLDGTVSVIDLTTKTPVEVIQSTAIPLPPLLLHGKRLFHSANRAAIARDQWISCAACHFDGEMDGRTWHFAAGPRNTPSLLGVVQTYPINWSAELDESQDLEHFIRGLQAGSGLMEEDPYPSLGMFNVGRSLELDSLAAFVDAFPMPLNASAGLSTSPAIPPGGPVPEAVQRGRLVFQSAETGCATCHPAPFYTDGLKHDVGTADGPGETAGPELDTPTLRGLIHTAPYLHDGTAPTLYHVLVPANPNDKHGVTSHLTLEEIADLIAFLEALPYEPYGSNF